MGSLDKRLERLEALAGGKAGPPGGARSRVMERYLHTYENARREIEGRELLPDLPYTEEDHEDDRRFLEETIPAYRELPGWQSEEGRAILNWWEQHTRDKLAKAERSIEQ
jgi:hypothetical protein